MTTRLRKRLLPGLLLPLLAGLSACAHGEDPPLDAGPDAVFHNGRIVTMDADFSVVSALAVDDGRVLAVGGDEEMLALAGSTARRVDLDGKMVLPGLIDLHQHPNQAAVSEVDHPIPAMSSIAEILDYVRQRAETLPEDEWIWVRTVHPGRLKERRYPTREELDSAAPRHAAVYAPYIFYPKASFNSVALARLGIDRAYASEHAADIERDPATGEPTGLIRNHTRYVEDWGDVDSTDFEQKMARFRDMMSIYNSVGLTTISDRKATREWTEVYRALDREGMLTTRMSLMAELDTGKDRAVDAIAADIVAFADEGREINGPMLQMIGVKVFLDGGITSGTARLLEPWGRSDIFAIDDPDYRGNLNLSGERLEALIEASAKAGLQFTGHTVGDGAVTELVRAYESVSGRAPLLGLRPSLTHANFWTPELIEKVARLGIVADVQPVWLYLDGAMLIEQLGEDRLRYFQPLRSLFEAGAMVGGGSDHWHRLDPYTAVNPFDPFLGMWIAMQRSPRFRDERLYPGEALNRREALRMYTTNNAYLLFRENEIGSLEPGKLADFIIVDRDVLTSGLEEFRDTRVLETYLGGELVYAAQREGRAP